MTGYGRFTKLFEGIVFSTVWREEMHVKIVWITMLALANQHGHVSASLPGLADAARVSLSDCEDALLRLADSDPHSRSKEYEGRRIEEVEGGWRILNYLKYRELGRHEVATTTTVGYVYYVLADDSIKIGFSKNPWARLSDLKVARPNAVLLATEKGTLDLERERQAQFSAQRVGGEWFRAEPPLTSFVDTLVDNKERTPTTVDTVATVATTKKQKQKQITNNWLSPFVEAWRKAYGGEPAMKVLATYIGPLRTEHGADETLRRWKAYLLETPAQFAKPAKFSQTFGSWGGKRATEDLPLLNLGKE